MTNTTRITDPCDMLVWPDAAWCYRYELAEYSHRSDDYTTLFVNTPEYTTFSMAQFEAEWERQNAVIH